MGVQASIRPLELDRGFGLSHDMALNVASRENILVFRAVQLLDPARDRELKTKQMYEMDCRRSFLGIFQKG